MGNNTHSHSRGWLLPLSYFFYKNIVFAYRKIWKIIANFCSHIFWIEKDSMQNEGSSSCPLIKMKVMKKMKEYEK